MNSILTILLDILIQEKPDSSNYIISKYLINNIAIAHKLSTTSLAKECHVSKATISRFCRKIGLEDFMELKMLLRTYWPDLDKKFYYTRKTNDIIHDYFSDIHQKVYQLQQNLDYYLLDQLVKDIHSYQKVILMGHMQSANIAFSLQQDLRPLNKLVECSHDMIGQKQLLVNSTPDTLIIVFSATGSFFKITLRRENLMKVNQCAKIYLITTNTFRKPNYIDTVIELDTEYNYVSSSILMQIYANLIALKYKDLFVS